MRMRTTYLVEEVSEYLRFHPHTIRRLARQGKIPAFKVGGQWRFDVKTINEWKQGVGVENVNRESITKST